MTTFNGERYLQDHLDSFLLQKRLPDELVVCDDCSRGSTVEIINNFSLVAPFPVRLFNNESNLGFIKNFQKATEHCQGDIIAFADQDDVWLPQKLLRIEQAFQQHPQPGFVVTDAELVGESLRSLGKTKWGSDGFSPQKRKRFLEGEALIMLLRKEVCLQGASLAFLSRLRKFILPFPENWSHDEWIPLAIVGMSDFKPAIISEYLIRLLRRRPHLRPDAHSQHHAAVDNAGLHLRLPRLRHQGGHGATACLAARCTPGGRRRTSRR